MIVFMITSLLLLGSSRLAGCIRIVALQGILLSLLPLMVSGGGLTIDSLILSIGTIILKGMVFPWLLSRAIREAEVRREVEPFVGYITSLGFGGAAFVISLWIGSRLPVPHGEASSLTLSVAFFTILTGFFLIVTRRKAISQVLGYLTLENGIYTFGVGLAYDEPLLVDLGILLDIFVAVFVMGITLFHINREFDSISTDQLVELKDGEK